MSIKGINWDRLVENITEGKVIPIIGTELQEIERELEVAAHHQDRQLGFLERSILGPEVYDTKTTINQLLAKKLVNEYLPDEDSEDRMLSDAIFYICKKKNLKH